MIAKVMPVLTGATETISESFREYLNNISGNYEIEELNNETILGTAHIHRKVLT
jgi:hypothetical protein